MMKLGHFKKKLELTAALMSLVIVSNAQDMNTKINAYLTPLLVSAFVVAVAISFFHNLSKISSQQDGDRKAGWVAIGMTAAAAFIITMVIGLVVSEAKTAFTM